MYIVEKIIYKSLIIKPEYIIRQHIAETFKRPFLTARDKKIYIQQAAITVSMTCSVRRGIRKDSYVPEVLI